MGNNNFLGYVAGAYQNQQQQNRANEELAMQRRQQELALQNAMENQQWRREENERRKKRDAREDEEYEYAKKERDRILESRSLAPIIKPFVPNLYSDPTGKQTFEAQLPSGMMGNILDAVGGTGLAGAPGAGIMLPEQITVDNFETGDQIEKRRSREEAIDLEVAKKRRLADEGLIRDYDRYPIGVRSGRHAKNSSSSAGSTGSTPAATASLKDPITAPAIPVFQPYKTAVDLYSRGSEDEKQAFSLRVKELSETTPLSPVEAKKIVLQDLNKIQEQNYQAALAAEQERLRKEKLSTGPKKSIGAQGVEDRANKILGISSDTKIGGNPLAASPLDENISTAAPRLDVPTIQPLIPDTMVPPGVPGYMSEPVQNSFYPQMDLNSFYNTLEENAKRQPAPMPPVLQPPRVDVPPGVPGYGSGNQKNNSFYPQFDPAALEGIEAQFVYRENPFWEQLNRFLFPTVKHFNSHLRP